MGRIEVALTIDKFINTTIKNKFPLPRIDETLEALSRENTFQSLTYHILLEYIGMICFIYLDDIIIFSKTKDHSRDLTKLLNAQKDEGLKIKRSKCKFFIDSISYHGHIVSSDGIRCYHKKGMSQTGKSHQTKMSYNDLSVSLPTTENSFIIFLKSLHLCTV
ncbi:hypothetical protein RF11_01114 [Thelohanellus kitauei]|uniref:Reverse transcriptase domain-containing protein n=1 Tax=Thelohanellus kitauei TaxID=669202 RepID=A0A0C2MY70_THEKT|nr:hypothetical protein RF11_01114 [Thelohanellus kitauei]